MAKQGSNNKELFYEDFPGLFFCEYFSRQKYNTFGWGRAVRMSSDLNLMLIFFRAVSVECAKRDSHCGL